MHLRRLLVPFVAVFMASCASMAQLPSSAPAVSETPPPFQEEFRGAWIATVANIDWPTSQGLSTAAQQAELRALLDRAVALHLNAVVFQIRPAADALYDSPIEPWSEYLSGQQGEAPNPYYDPLAFAVDEAHKRGLELHAWINPYRAKHHAGTDTLAANHVSKTRSEAVKSYGGYLWLDPGHPQAVSQTLRVVRDVVQRYDVDGVHIDDYFYPYPVRDEAGQTVPFPDEDTWQAAVTDGWTGTREDWRRHNVDRLVRQMYEVIRSEKSWVKFGVSPFGIWRPGNPPSIRGFDAYDAIYADALKWYQEGWLDYLTPQLYWPIEQEPQSFTTLLDWWIEQNVQARHLWVGQYTSKLSTNIFPDNAWSVDEITRQILETRARPEAGGTIHFSMKALTAAHGQSADTLRQTVYAAPALVPATPWLDDLAPDPPALSVSVLDDVWDIAFMPQGTQAVFRWAIAYRTPSGWVQRIQPGWQQRIELARDLGASEIYVHAIDRTGNVSASAQATLSR